jgi:hypothetical protein
MWMFFGLLALIVLFAGALGFVLFRQRGRVYALGSSRTVASSAVNTVASSAANAGSSKVVKAS